MSETHPHPNNRARHSKGVFAKMLAARGETLPPPPADAKERLIDETGTLAWEAPAQTHKPRNERSTR